MADAKPGRRPQGRKSAPPALAGTGQRPGQPDAAAGPEQVEDDLKRKFREALDRKRAQQAASNAQRGGPGDGKVPSAHGPAHSRRSFRRKSGG